MLTGHTCHVPLANISYMGLPVVKASMAKPVWKPQSSKGYETNLSAFATMIIYNHQKVI
jgi:hypothetical protein